MYVTNCLYNLYYYCIINIEFKTFIFNLLSYAFTSKIAIVKAIQISLLISMVIFFLLQLKTNLYCHVIRLLHSSSVIEQVSSKTKSLEYVKKIVYLLKCFYIIFRGILFDTFHNLFKLICDIN